MEINFSKGEIGEITFLVSPSGNVYPEKDLPENERTLKVSYGGKMKCHYQLKTFSVKMILI